ncbi:hypothetical protein [Amycolatopsis sp. lyj-346]|uniref:hypothetical protein n=1 Tax=Amycolatopsis sp. lyj-346 TaxID=2789289 RepID=UPI00397A626C
MNVFAAQLHEGLAVFRDALEGKSVRAGRLGELGPVSGLLVDTATGWRVDALARTHRFYAALLEEFRTKGTAKPQFGLSSDYMQRVVGFTNGIRCSPVSVAEARRLAGAAETGRNYEIGTMKNWAWMVVKDPAVQSRAVELLGDPVRSAGTPGLGALPTWPDDPRLWPGAREWERLRAILLERLPHLIAAEWQASMPELLPDLVRQIAGDQAYRYLVVAKSPAAQKAGRWLRHRALRAWQRDVVVPSEEVSVEPARSTNTFPEKDRRRAAAAVQLSFGQAVHAARRLPALVAARSVDDLVLGAYRTWVPLPGTSILLSTDVQLSVQLAKLGAVLRSTPRDPGLLRAGPLPERMMRGEEYSDPEALVHDLTQTAANLRARLRREDAPVAARLYCAGRRLVTTREPKLILEVDLADHSVDWDLVGLTGGAEGAELRHEFRRSVETAPLPPSGNPGLRVHRLRSEMVLATKNNRWQAGLIHGMDAFVQSHELRKAGVLRGEYFLETVQQIALGLAGLWTKQAEQCLLVEDLETLTAPPAYFIRHALWWSTHASNLLELLRDELPEVRGVDGRIGNIRWVSQTPTLVLRAQLCGLSALRAGICRSRDLVSDELPMPPAVLVSLDEVDRLYVSMLSDEYVHPGLALQLALWCSLLHPDARLPVVPAGQVSQKVEELDVLHCAPDAPDQSVRLDLADTTRQLRRHNYDANIIGRLSTSSMLYRYFTSVHPQFGAWLASWRGSRGEPLPG